MTEQTSAVVRVPRFDWEVSFRAWVAPSTIKALGLTMATYANRDGSSIHPGRTRLAANLGVSERTISTGLAALRAAGYIEEVTRPDGRAGRASGYRLTLPEDQVQVDADHVQPGADHVQSHADHVQPDAQPCEAGCTPPVHVPTQGTPAHRTPAHVPAQPAPSDAPSFDDGPPADPWAGVDVGPARRSSYRADG